MPFTFACPNPACTQVFSQQEVRGVASLTCPKCGHVFQFGPGPVPAAPVGRPVAKPAPLPKPAPVVSAPPPAAPAAIPVAKPVPAPRPAAVPLALPVTADSRPEVFVPPPEPRPARRGAKAPAPKGKRARSRKVWLIPVVLLGLLLGFGVAGWVFSDQWFGGTTEDARPEVRSLGLNYAFRLPAAPWKADEDVKRRLGASLAMGRREPNSWFGFVAHDFKDRMPRDDEMLREAVTRLQQLFNKTAQSELRDEDSFAGLPAQRLVFTAENSNSVPVVGECVMLASNGIGYWFFGWTPEVADRDVLAAVQKEWATIRDGFTLLKEREGWTGKTPEIVEAEGKKAGYRLKYAKGVWENDPGRDDADLLLHGSDPDHPQDGRRWAWVRVFVLPAAGDDEAALKAARDYVEKREKKLYAELKMDAVPEAAKGGLTDGPVKLGQAPGQMVRLRVKKGEDYEHFFAVAAVPRPEFTLVLVGECAWSEREAWEDRIGPVMHSLRFDKK